MNEYEGYAAAEGKKLLVVQLSLKSTVTFLRRIIAGFSARDKGKKFSAYDS